MVRRLYDWVLHWSLTPFASWALLALAFSESSFFPIPPDVLLIAMAVADPQRAFRFASISSAGSVLGGCLGYLIGLELMDTVGSRIISFYGLAPKMAYIGSLYHQYDAWAVGIAGFTPIPYKLFTISAGMFKIDFGVFLLASLVSRSARFFAVAGLIYLFGPGIQRFIDRWFNLLAVTFTVLLVLGFALLRYVF